MMKSLRNVAGKVEYAMENSTGKAGGTLTEEIGDATHFSLQYPVMASDKRHGATPSLTLARANGSVVIERTNMKEQTHPVGVPAKAPTDLANTWTTVGAREVFAGLVDGRTPISDYVSALTDPKNGYQTQVRERSLSYRGQTIKQYEIRAVKQHGDPKIGGASNVSLIFDSTVHLPVTLTVTIQKPGTTKPDGISMDLQWAKDVKIDPKDFQPLPPPQVVK